MQLERKRTPQANKNESDLEQALMDHLPDKRKLEEFMLKELEEMGM